MSKHQAIRTIRTEIERLNREIDLRIIKGLSYKSQSKRHKFLMAQLTRLSRSQAFERGFSFGGWFGKSLSFMSAFMF